MIFVLLAKIEYTQVITCCRNTWNNSYIEFLCLKSLIRGRMAEKNFKRKRNANTINEDWENLFHIWVPTLMGCQATGKIFGSMIKKKADVCPDLTIGYDNISSKIGRRRYYGYRPIESTISWRERVQRIFWIRHLAKWSTLSTLWLPMLLSALRA